MSKYYVVITDAYGEGRRYYEEYGLVECVLGYELGEKCKKKYAEVLIQDAVDAFVNGKENHIEKGEIGFNIISEELFQNRFGGYEIYASNRLCPLICEINERIERLNRDAIPPVTNVNTPSTAPSETIQTTAAPAARQALPIADAPLHYMAAKSKSLKHHNPEHYRISFCAEFARRFCECLQ